MKNAKQRDSPFTLQVGVLALPVAAAAAAATVAAMAMATVASMAAAVRRMRGLTKAHQ